MVPPPRKHAKPSLVLELELRRNGFTSIAGIDEAGRGAWAGPLVAAAVVLPVGQRDLPLKLHAVRDSKLMTPRQRGIWIQNIQRVALGIGVGRVSPQEVDAMGLIPATRTAMQRALSALPTLPSYLLIDYLTLPDVKTPQTALPHGDATVLSIAAASVVAKVTRDQMMVSLAEDHPGYGFAAHKGYGTAQHRLALHRLGPCLAHRFSFAPVATCAVIHG